MRYPDEGPTNHDGEVPVGVEPVEDGSARRLGRRALLGAGAMAGMATALLSADPASAATPSRILYVSRTGSDGNSGGGWGTAFATVRKALATLGSAPGTVYIAGGVYRESGLVIHGDQRLKGAGCYATVLELAAPGTLINLANRTGGRLESLGLRFGGPAVTGKLIDLNNSFDFAFVDVRLSGSSTRRQFGVHIRANAGDSHFINCHFDHLDVAVQNASTVNYFMGCVFSSQVTAALQGGDPAGKVEASGLVVNNSTFRGTGKYYINVNGRAQAWTVSECWFDGHADTAIQIGAGTHGPWMFTLSDIPGVAGRLKSIVVDAAGSVALKNVTFIDTGTHPAELTIDPIHAPRGSIGSVWSTQGKRLEATVPATWEGFRGYARSADYSVQVTEETTPRSRSAYPEPKRVIVRVTGRIPRHPAVTVQFPSPFGPKRQLWRKAFDNTGLTGVRIDSTGITIPTGQACEAGMIILEGF